MGWGLASALLVGAAGGCDEPGPAEMEIFVVESGAAVEGTLPVARGLAFDVALRVDAGDGEWIPPDDLEVAPSGSVLVERLGAVGFDYDGRPSHYGIYGEGELVRLTPQTAGSGSVRFFADNALEDPTLWFDAREVEAAAFSVSVQGDTGSGSSGDELTVFGGNRLFVEAIYTAGGVPVAGREAFVVEAPAGSGTHFLDASGDPFSSAMLELGEAPHDARVTSPASGAAFTVHAVDLTALWNVTLRVDGEPFDAAAPFRLDRGAQVLVELQPLDRTGARIPGEAPAAWGYEVRGTSVREGGPSMGGVLFEAAALGESTVVLAWGAVQAALVIDVY